MMKKVLFLCLISLIASQTALGGIINPNRPVGSYPGTLNDIGTVFTNIGSSLDPVNNQSGRAIFEPAGTGTSAGTYVAQVSWAAGDLEFGIYEYGNIGNDVMLFNTYVNGGSYSQGDSVSIDFLPGSGQVISFSSSAGTIDSTNNYFEDFGFYINRLDANGRIEGNRYYSEDILNLQMDTTNGDPRFLTYKALGEMVTIGGLTGTDAEHWYVCAEAWDYENNGYSNTLGADFSDFIVLMESINPVPVPGAVLLGIIGLSAAGIKLRKYT